MYINSLIILTLCTKVAKGGGVKHWLPTDSGAVTATYIYKLIYSNVKGYFVNGFSGKNRYNGFSGKDRYNGFSGKDRYNGFSIQY